ncbi:DNA cytosine methyltransferase [Agrobacterium sp. lyk4-40-TYG-31]|uniref:DNA cytosine methyltransferase n=1 Tax=Agrobacterium sp. lyk4-40-TYG-31 TaxID=3040276 RepID=UPI00254C7BF5|nr:DNA cytosine methyltransferase [Agrobacterium sp. lyk4-40-TYG-31]
MRGKHRLPPTTQEASRDGFVPGLTNRMRARLQGFPDDWGFVGGMGPVADQIGNAVAHVPVVVILSAIERSCSVRPTNGRQRCDPTPPTDIRPASSATELGTSNPAATCFQLCPRA